METGNSSAGDGYKKDREQVLSVYIETVECVQVTGWICHKHTDNSADDHENQQVAVQIITWLKQSPYRNYTGNQYVSKDDNVPGFTGKEHRAVQTDGNTGYQHNDSDCSVNPFIQFTIFQDHTQSNGFQNEQHGSSSNGTVCCDCADYTCIVCSKTVKGSGYNVCKCCDNQNTEQPAEQKKQFLSELTDIFFNNISDGTAFVLYRCIHSSEILNGSKEYTTDQNP